MNKLLVEVYVPANQKVYDIYIPKSLFVFEAKKMVARLLNDLSEGLFQFDDNTLLCDRNDGQPLVETGLIGDVIGDDGAKLMII